MKFLSKVFILFFLLFSMMFSGAFGADNITETRVSDSKNHTMLVTITWTDDTGNGVSELLTKSYYNGWIMSIDTDPGDLAPTADYDIALQNSAGIDILAGRLADRHTTTSERVTLSTPAYSNGFPTLVITNTSTNSGLVTANSIVLHIYTEEK